jgi:hypothetical protein
MYVISAMTWIKTIDTFYGRLMVHHLFSKKFKVPGHEVIVFGSQSQLKI